MRSERGNSPSAAQLAVRQAFKDSVDCFNGSPRSGGAVPPELGYRSREWWFAQAALQLYPPYVDRDFATWDGEEIEPDDWLGSDDVSHPQPWFLQTDEADFIDFYDEMKAKYGYPWSSRNSPDEIVTKMNQIVCDEITYDPDANPFYAYTPGQTAKSRKGICDDQSILHYALTWKALKELSWTDEEIDARLGVVINAQSGQGHVYNWWKTHLGSTKIVENTYDPGTSPRVMGDMAYWGATGDTYLLNRFNKTKSYLARFTSDGITRPLWYFNYFMQHTFPVFYADTIPDWCGLCIPIESIGQAYYKNLQSTYFHDYEDAWAAAWNLYQNNDWVAYPYEQQYLYGYGRSDKSAAWDPYRGQIYGDKVPLTFKPIDHISPARWAQVDKIKIAFKTSYWYEPNDGGSIRCIESGETQAQAYGITAFYLPKEICTYEEFTLTFETLSLTITDLKPLAPVVDYSYHTVGFSHELGWAKLYCTGEGIY